MAIHYHNEGWSHLYYALAGTDTQILLDMLTQLFSEPSLLEPEELDLPSVKHMQKEGISEELEVQRHLEKEMLRKSH